MTRRGSNVAGKPPSQRQLRVGEMLRHALAEILQRGDIADPVLEVAVVTVPEVRATPDLRHATAFVMPLGGQHVDEVIAALNRNRKFIRGELAHKVTLKYMPDLTFEIDRSFDEGDRIDQLLRSPEVARDLGPEDGGDGD
ncbi:30S ribosome-binding factor RbfA [Microbaculum marinum]|uniref:Ribosome-binding factor A n=1 Tax=Microbaculum marinum TaxID=1764581 RepID=A0AAW9RZ81_9HYPH